MRTKKKKKKKQRYFKKLENIVVVLSAHQLDESQIQKVKNKFGDDKEYQIEIDPNLVGGIKIKTANEVFDGSVSFMLHELKNKLKNNAQDE